MNTGDIDALDILQWLHLHDGQSVDWVSGSIILGAALLGALLTLFFDGPTNLSGLGGADSVLRLQGDMVALEAVQSQSLAGASEKDKNLSQRESFLRYMHSRFAREHRLLMVRGVSIFVIVGPLTALALATTAWQALLLGATGPSLWRASLSRKTAISIADEASKSLEILDNETLHQLEIARARHDLISEYKEQVREGREKLEAAYGALNRMRGAD